MNRKNVVILSIYFVAGIVLVIAGLRLDTDYYSTLIFATGAGLALSAAANLFREYRHTRPEHQPAYEKKMKEQSIDLKDERKVFLRYKASYHTLHISMGICYFGAAILAWLRADATVITVLFVVAVVQYVAALLIYRYFCAKM